MAVDLSVQLFDAFLGSQEGIHSIPLPDVFSSGGSKNLYIDKYGRAKRILGYTTQNSTPVVTDTGNSATLVRNLFHYRTTAGGAAVRRLIGVFDDGVDEWEIKYSTDQGVTWTHLTDAGAGSVGAIADFSQFGDQLFLTNGIFAPKLLSGTSLTQAGGTQSPTPTAVAASSAGALIGTYKYKLVSRVGGTRQLGSLQSTPLAVQDKQIALSWTADANTSVTGYELYRTDGTGDVFYFVNYIDGRLTVSTTDNTPDETILENRVLEEHGDPPPPGAMFCESHKQRMWWFRTSTNPTRGYFSDPGLPDSVYTDANFIDFSDAETIGDVCTGSIGNFEGQLVVGTERALWTVSGTGQVIGNEVDWTRTKTNAQTGWVSHRTVAKIPAGSKYIDQHGRIQVTNVVTLAYFTPLLDLRIFDGDNDLVISHPVKTTIATANYAQRAKFHCLHDPSRAEVTWMFATGANGEPDSAVTWNYRWGVWYVREWGFASAVEVDSSSEASVLLAGERSTTTGGYLYKLWSGNSFNGSAFRSQWMTKTLYGVNDQAQPALSETKRYRWADFVFETEQTTTLTIEWLPGNTPDTAAAFGSTRIAPAASHLLTADGDRVVTADGDALVVSSASTTARAKLKNSAGQYLHDTGMRLRIYDESTNGSWSLEGIELAYQRLPGLQRRMQD